MEQQIPVRGGTYVLHAIQGKNGELTPCDVVDAKMNALSTARAIDVFGGASYWQALNRALHEAELEATKEGKPWPPVAVTTDDAGESATEGVEIIESPASPSEPSPASTSAPTAVAANAEKTSPKRSAAANAGKSKSAGKQRAAKKGPVDKSSAKPGDEGASS